MGKAISFYFLISKFNLWLKHFHFHPILWLKAIKLKSFKKIHLSIYFTLLFSLIQIVLERKSFWFSFFYLMSKKIFNELYVDFYRINLWRVFYLQNKAKVFQLAINRIWSVLIHICHVRSIFGFYYKRKDKIYFSS